MQKHLITSALPYINGIKHLGNLIGSILPADVYARFLRQQGHDVLYICGTDEHGTPAEISAKQSNKPIKEFCKVMYKTQKEIYEKFHIQFDYFGRSSNTNNHKLTQDIFKKLDKNNYIQTKNIKQIYSHKDERFLPDRFVEGTCPYCNAMARGDQCDQCGKLLDPTDLINPVSTISGSTQLEIKETKHIFLDLHALEQNIITWVQEQTHWPNLTKGIAGKWLKEGLKARCISRDLKWGIPIPKNGFEDKVFYVWFDAPIAYISITQDWAEKNNQDWKDWWQNKNIEYTQFMAKDNVPFHAIFWPATLLGTKDNWNLVTHLKSFNWLNYEGGKFSTSKNRGVFTDQALEIFPADYWRYYLMAVIPENSDSDFSFKDLGQILNKDLGDVLGNFINRVTTLIFKYFEGKVPDIELDWPDELKINCTTLIKEYEEFLTNRQFRQSLQTLRKLWVIGNEFISIAAPWTSVKENIQKAGNDLRICLELLYIYAVASSCVIPNLSKQIFSLLGQKQDPSKINFNNLLAFSFLKPKQKIEKSGHFFPKITDSQIEELTQKYKGI